MSLVLTCLFLKKRAVKTAVPKPPGPIYEFNSKASFDSSRCFSAIISALRIPIINQHISIPTDKPFLGHSSPLPFFSLKFWSDLVLLSGQSGHFPVQDFC